MFRFGTETIFENLLLASIEALALQSIFVGLFNISHNSGTWFVSCLSICYLVFPFIQEMVKQMTVKSKTILLLISILVLLWSPIIQILFYTESIYSNPFFRLIEFIIGMFLCSLKHEIDSIKNMKSIQSWKSFLLEFIMLIFTITLISKIGVPKDYMLYNWAGYQYL